MAVPAHQHASRRPSAGRGRQRLRAESHPRLDLRGPILGAPPPVLPCDWQADGEQADLVLRGARRPIIQHVALLLSTNRPSAHRCAIPSTSSCVADGWGVLLLSAGSRGRWRMRRSQRRRASSRRASPPAPAPVSPLNRFPSAGCEWCHCSRPAPALVQCGERRHRDNVAGGIAIVDHGEGRTAHSTLLYAVAAAHRARHAPCVSRRPPPPTSPRTTLQRPRLYGCTRCVALTRRFLYRRTGGVSESDVYRQAARRIWRPGRPQTAPVPTTSERVLMCRRRHPTSWRTCQHSRQTPTRRPSSRERARAARQGPHTFAAHVHCGARRGLLPCPDTEV